MKMFALALVLFSASFAHADTIDDSKIKQIDSAFNACAEKAQSTADQNSCADKAYKAADAELNRIYSLVEKSVKKDNDETSKEIMKRLVTSERAWVAYRDANCSLEGVQMLGGSGEGPIVGGCLASLTIQRVGDLVSIFGQTK